MCRQQRRYLSYLLRLWQAQGTDNMVWRASLEGARSSEQAGFATLDDLFAFLRTQTLIGPESGSDREGNGKPLATIKGDSA